MGIGGGRVDVICVHAVVKALANEDCRFFSSEEIVFCSIFWGGGFGKEVRKSRR